MKCGSFRRPYGFAPPDWTGGGGTFTGGGIFTSVRPTTFFPSIASVFELPFGSTYPINPPLIIIVSWAKVISAQLPHSAGSSAVNAEQQGFSVAWRFINSARMPSGSYMLNWPLPSLPIFGLSSWTPVSRLPAASTL